MKVGQEEFFSCHRGAVTGDGRDGEHFRGEAAFVRLNNPRRQDRLLRHHIRQSNQRATGRKGGQ